jgi:hypothetical protein
MSAAPSPHARALEALGAKLAEAGISERQLLAWLKEVEAIPPWGLRAPGHPDAAARDFARAIGGRCRAASITAAVEPRKTMSTEIIAIPETGVKGAELQITQFAGPAELGPMLQLTQGLGLFLDDPGFIQLTRQDVQALIPVLLHWLNKTDPPEASFQHWYDNFWKYGSSTDLVRARRAFEAAKSYRSIAIAGTS